MNERVFSGPPDRLRAPDRVAMLEVDRVVALALDGLQPASVLDVGTGSGLFAEAFAKQRCVVSGIDSSATMVETAKGMVPSVDFRVGSAEDLPFPDKSFDIVFFGLVLHEADDLRQALKEAARVCRTRAVALEWPYVLGEKGPPLAHRLKPETIESAALQAGFEGVRMHPLSTLVLYTMA